MAFVPITAPQFCECNDRLHGRAFFNAKFSQNDLLNLLAIILTLNFANAMTVFTAGHFQRKILLKMIGLRIPAIILIPDFANAMTIFYGIAFLTQNS